MRKFEHTAELKHESTAAWIRRKYKALDLTKKESDKVLEELFLSGGWTADRLAEQWELQKEEQLSARRCTFSPADSIPPAQRSP